MVAVDRPVKRQPPEIVGEVLIPASEEGVEVVLISEEEGLALFDYWAHEYLGISGDEFLLRYDRGDYDDVTEKDDFGRRYINLVMKLGLAGRNPFAR